MHSFMGQNFQIFPLYILLTRKINTFRSKAFDKFWSRGIGIFEAQKIIKEKLIKLPNDF